MDWEKISGELNRKLDPAHVMPAKSFGPKGDYLEGWFVISEANRIFGFDGWSYTVPECTVVHQGPREIGQAKKPGWGVTYTAKVRLVVRGAEPSEDFGAGHGYDVDLGLAHESAIKEAVTDALKRALKKFGNKFGLALYDKSRENVGVDAPTASPAEIEVACGMLSQAPDLATLKKIFGAYYKDQRHVADHPAVVDAKESRKAQLTPQEKAA
jgi:DNA recombination protein Rad52